MPVLASTIFSGDSKQFSGPLALSETQQYQAAQPYRWQQIANGIMSLGGNESSVGSHVNSGWAVAGYNISGNDENYLLESVNRPLVDDFNASDLTPDDYKKILGYLLVEYGSTMGAMNLNVTTTTISCVANYIIEDKFGAQLPSEIKYFSEKILPKVKYYEEQVQKTDMLVQSIDASIRSKFQLKMPSRLWAEKAKNHGSNIELIGASIVVLIFITIASVITHGDNYLSHIPKNKDGDFSFAAISLIALPAIAIGWIFRIILKIFSMNIELRQDALQRSAMIETYLSLLADPKAGFDEKDRAILLSAIFRPVNSTQQEVSPPSIADFVKPKDP